LKPFGQSGNFLSNPWVPFKSGLQKVVGDCGKWPKISFEKLSSFGTTEIISLGPPRGEFVKAGGFYPLKKASGFGRKGFFPAI